MITPETLSALKTHVASRTTGTFKSSKSFERHHPEILAALDVAGLKDRLVYATTSAGRVVPTLAFNRGEDVGPDSISYAFRGVLVFSPR